MLRANIGLSASSSKNELPLNIRREVISTCVLPVLTFCAQTRYLTNRQTNQLNVCEKIMEKGLLDVSLRDCLLPT